MKEKILDGSNQVKEADDSNGPNAVNYDHDNDES
jgi:hypothetical protein